MADKPNRVTVSDFDMPFLSMVRFMVKWAIAAIPALLILVILSAVFGGMLFGFFSTLGSRITSSRTAESPAAAVNPYLAKLPDSKSSGPAAGNADADSRAYRSKVFISNLRVGQSALDQPAAFGEIRNGGDRTLSEVEITVYCLDATGKPVFEETAHPVLVSEFSYGDANKPLKPGYSRKFGVTLDDAPSTWSKEVRAVVTGVKF
jgi:hypothetical protein